MESICLEILGPYSKCILLQNLLSNDPLRILACVNLSHYEKIIVKSAEDLPDNRISFILYIIFSQSLHLSRFTLQSYYQNYPFIQQFLISKATFNPNAGIQLGRTFFLSKHSDALSTKLLSISLSLIQNTFSHPYLKNLPSPYIIHKGQNFTSFSGVLIRGQCDFIYEKKFCTKKSAVLKNIDFMEVQYSGDYQGIYDESYIKCTRLITFLNDNDIKVLISDIEKVWVKEACRACKVTLITNPHPDDFAYFFTSVVYDEICGLGVFTCCFDVNIDKFAVCGRFYIENAQPVGVLPEVLGKEYEKSIRKIVRIWEMWSENYLVVPAGGFFEIQLCRVLGDCELRKAFWEFLMKFIKKMPKPKALWKTFLVEFSCGKDFSIRADMENMGKADIVYENDNEYIEAISVKLEVFRKFLEVSLQISRIEGVIVNRKAK